RSKYPAIVTACQTAKPATSAITATGQPRAHQPRRPCEPAPAAVFVSTDKKSARSFDIGIQRSSASGLKQLRLLVATTGLGQRALHFHRFQNPQDLRHVRRG